MFEGLTWLVRGVTAPIWYPIKLTVDYVSSRYQTKPYYDLEQMEPKWHTIEPAVLLYQALLLRDEQQRLATIRSVLLTFSTWRPSHDEAMTMLSDIVYHDDIASLKFLLAHAAEAWPVEDILADATKFGTARMQSCLQQLGYTLPSLTSNSNVTVAKFSDILRQITVADVEEGRWWLINLGEWIVRTESAYRYRLFLVYCGAKRVALRKQTPTGSLFWRWARQYAPELY